MYFELGQKVGKIHCSNVLNGFVGYYTDMLWAGSVAM